MAFFLNLMLTLSLFTTLFVPVTPQAQAHPCNSYKFPNDMNFASCKDLAVLDSSIHWNYYSSSSTIEMAFKKANAKESSWVAWAINPTSSGMVGSQALVAIRTSDGTLNAYTSPITSYATMLQQGNLSFPLHTLSASYRNSSIIIFATFQLPTNKTLVNHVWQEGPVADDGTLRPHSFSGPNLQSFGTIDFASGKVFKTVVGKNSRTTLKNVHGLLNGISWGILMPIGVVIARYMKVFDASLGPTWFHLHRAIQSLAYLIGVVGFGTGLYMGNHYRVHHAPHRCVGITLVCLASAQVLVAVFLRPKKDHKYRIFWNIFHYVVGYVTIGCSIWNVLMGFNLFGGAHKGWKHAYIGIIISLAAIALVLEVITWIWNRKKGAKEEQVDTINHEQP